jgi:hypothetical protein
MQNAAQIDLNALADVALATFDYSAEYEDDQFAFTFDGARVYCQRKRTHFLLHIGAERHRLPRC